jgi:hypothetical protein
MVEELNTDMDMNMDMDQKKSWADLADEEEEQEHQHDHKSSLNKSQESIQENIQADIQKDIQENDSDWQQVETSSKRYKKQQQQQRRHSQKPPIARRDDRQPFDVDKYVSQLRTKKTPDERLQDRDLPLCDFETEFPRRCCLDLECWNSGKSRHREVRPQECRHGDKCKVKTCIRLHPIQRRINLKNLVDSRKRLQRT